MVTQRAHPIPLGAMAAFISLGVGLMTGPVSALTVTRSAFDPINGLVHHV